ncbi:MAG: V-type ATPase subunit [Clostridia bacterium]|nr:V-type ATPase subunit [Clostridia bacterium]
MSLQPNDYLYSSARIHAMEGRMIGREKLERMLEAPTAAEAMALVGAPEMTAPAAREAWFSAQLADAYREILAILPAPDAVRFLQYPYDCNNIKAVLKCAVRGIDPASMLSSCATLPVEAYAAMAETKDYSALPTNMAAAAEAAYAAYAHTADPQQIDLILDRACYADMCAAAKSPFTAQLVRVKIDLTNLMIFLRVLRMGLTESNRAMLEAALLPGGDVPVERFRAAVAGGESGLREALASSVCARVLDRADGEAEPTLAALECACDDVWMAYVREARYVSFGEAVPVAYLIAWETAVKNMRIICAGKDAGLPRDIIRERMRACYA